MSLLAVQILQPCAESWDAMTPTSTGRHCAACQKTVIDFTWETDAEILAYLANASGETCGRLAGDQQNRTLANPAPASPAPRWRTWLATALALWGMRESSSLGAEASARPIPSAYHSPGKAPRYLAKGSKLLHGTVRDAATHKPLAGVAVFLKGENRAATTDSVGYFSLRLPTRRAAARRHLVLHRAGYFSRQLLLASATGTLRVDLSADPAATGVEVVAVYKEQKREIMGGAISVMVVDEKAPSQPNRQPVHGFLHWLTRPFRGS